MPPSGPSPGSLSDCALCFIVHTAWQQTEWRPFALRLLYGAAMRRAPPLGMGRPDHTARGEIRPFLNFKREPLPLPQIVGADLCGEGRSGLLLASTLHGVVLAAGPVPHELAAGTASSLWLVRY